MTNGVASVRSFNAGDACNSTSIPPEAIINHDELTDLRAYQRTFDGAYTRTALGQLSYAILILKLFEKDFYWCGLIYTTLAIQLIFVSAYRYNLAVSNVDRWKNVNMTTLGVDEAGSRLADEAGNVPARLTTITTAASHDDAIANASTISHIGHQRLFRRTFRTAGGVIAWATAGTLLLEVALAVLVVRM